jgi:hypothetical protein
MRRVITVLTMTVALAGVIRSRDGAKFSRDPFRPARKYWYCQRASKGASPG